MRRSSTPDFDAPAEPIGVEYAVSAVSAPTVDAQLVSAIESNLVLKGLGLGDLVGDFNPNLLATNPHIVHAESTRNGIAIVSIGGDAVDVTFLAVDDVTARSGGVASEVSFHTPTGSRRVLPGLSAGRTRPDGSPA